MFIKFILGALVGLCSVAGIANTNFEGKIDSVEAIKVVDENLNVSEVSFSGKLVDYKVWGRSIELFVEGAAELPTERCGGNLIGRLEKPFSVKGKLNGENIIITVPANRAMAFKKSGCSTTGKLMGISIDVKDNFKGSIVVDKQGSNKNQLKVLSDYKVLRKSSKAKLRKIKKDIAKGDYVSARLAYSKLVEKNELYSTDIAELNIIFSSVFPKEESPIASYKIPQNLLEDVEDALGLDIDSISANQLLGALEAFALDINNEAFMWNEERFFELALSLATEDKRKADLLITSFETRMNFLKELVNTDSAESTSHIVRFAEAALFELALNKFNKKQADRVKKYLAAFKAQYVHDYQTNPKWKDFVNNKLYSLTQMVIKYIKD